MSRLNSLPVLAFTMGDPAGIGPDICLRTIKHTMRNQPFIPILFGSKILLEQSFLSASLTGLRIEPFQEETALETGVLYFQHSYDLSTLQTGAAFADNGLASEAYIVDATRFISNGLADALVTAPICKESLELAGLSHTGHTSMLKALTHSDSVSMAFNSPTLRVILATIHVPLQNVPSMITQTLLHEKLHHAIHLLDCLGLKEKRIAVAGLNPHAGENGLFGSEEQAIIGPAIRSFDCDASVSISGPLPGDTVFHRAHQGEFDLVLAMYHDQGLIPIKCLNFGASVNVSVGLPFIRTSPDHGTAFDIAYKKEASIESMCSATEFALELLHHG